MKLTINPLEPSPKTYSDLKREIRLAIHRGKERAEIAVQQEKVRTCWEIGRLIDAHVLQHKKRAGYAQSVLVKLAKDLALDRSELYFMLEFAQANPIVCPGRQLSWAHYKQLLSINSSKIRNRMTEKAEREGWSKRELSREIQNLGLGHQPVNLALKQEILTAQPGLVGYYKMIRAAKGPYQGELAVDLGFSNYFRPKKFSFKEGDIVEQVEGRLRKRKGGAESDRFTYEAYLIEVIDGDTDLGFVRKLIKGRLQGFLRASKDDVIDSVMGQIAKRCRILNPKYLLAESHQHLVDL